MERIELIARASDSVEASQNRAPDVAQSVDDKDRCLIEALFHAVPLVLHERGMNTVRPEATMLFMLFEFIFGFVPITLIGYFGIPKMFPQRTPQVV